MTTTGSETVDIVALLRGQGPMTGSQLVEASGVEPLPLWRLFQRSDELAFEVVGQRYLRLDRSLEQWARLSPSIRREFLTYTVLGTRDQREAIVEMAREQGQHAREISAMKKYVAKTAMKDSLADLKLSPGIAPDVADHIGVIIAGDVTYDMAHEVPRPETSTGLMVKGSDLDIIVVVADDLPDTVLGELDKTIMRKKLFLLRQPQYREEIDFIIKRLGTIDGQLSFDTFEHAVASKILDEGQYLCGSNNIFDAVKAKVAASEVPQRLAELDALAVAERDLAAQHLLVNKEDHRSGRHYNLFYTQEERDEPATPQDIAAVVGSDVGRGAGPGR